MAVDPSLALQVEDLCLDYGARRALDHVSVAVPRGTLLGLLGPNGCGKSSLLTALCGTAAAVATVGHFAVDGVAMPLGDRALRQHLGVVFQEPSLDPHLSGRENLLLSARLFGLRGAAARQRLAHLLDAVGMAGRADERVRTLSGGLRRRLELARALMHRPRLLFLDEPTTGLDPLAFEQTWKTLGQLRQDGAMTLLCSTHRAEEAARCDRLLVLDAGKVVAHATPDELLARVAGDVITLQARPGPPLVTRLAEQFGLQAHATALAGGELSEITLRQPAGHTWVPRLIEACEPGRIVSVAVRRPTLADAFFELTGRALLPAAQQGAVR